MSELHQYGHLERPRIISQKAYQALFLIFGPCICMGVKVGKTAGNKRNGQKKRTSCPCLGEMSRHPIPTVVKIGQTESDEPRPRKLDNELIREVAWSTITESHDTCMASDWQ